ncbi:hypothetical protein HDU91_006000 [Kappamyces sp. JEL0680]|nr:hypothetical protein HDU91_006000 [Kappamyces sp. JEL0680]
MEIGNRVSFSTQIPNQSQQDDLIESLKAVSAERPTSFNLANRNLMRLPAEIGLLTELERIGLNNNKLSSLPTELLNLKALRYINLRSNSLREFPSVITKIPTLEVLDVSRNKIKRFPSDFGFLVNLRVGPLG